MEATIIRRRRLSGFTLIELLVVVAILALIGGATLVAYNGLQTQAARAIATGTIATTSNGIRNYEVFEKTLPDDLESLVAADVSGASPVYDPTTHNNTVPATDTLGSPVLTNILGSKLAGKFTVAALTEGQLYNLREAGIDTVRYIDAKGDDETVANLDIFNAAGTAAANVGPLSEISIPQHAFETPRTGSGRNRGRGFSYTLGAGVENGVAASNVSLAIWNAGTNGYNNIKVGGKGDAVLVGLGIGQASSIVDANSNTGFALAPYYGDVKKNEYPHFIALIDVNQTPAKFIAVVDPRGDFLDEEFAESTGQKK